MITTLTLNPCIDHTIEVEGIEIGGTNRIKKVTKNAAGKGINVSIALSQLGYDTCALVFAHEQGSAVITEYLRDKGIRCEHITVPGELRTNIKVFDCAGREMTEFNESGSSVPETAADEMLSLIRQQLAGTDILVVSGSVPPGVPEDFYGQVIRFAKSAGVITILDADHGLFREGVKAKPTMIKPNLGELQRYLGKTLDSENEIVDAAYQLMESGIEYVCVSVGADGAYLVCKDGVYYTKGADIEVRGVQGAGDSLVSGFAVGLMEKKSPEESLRLAVACANGSLLQEGTGMCQKEDVERLLRRIEIEKIG